MLGHIRAHIGAATISPAHQHINIQRRQLFRDNPPAQQFLSVKPGRSLFSLAELFPQELCKCSHVWIVRGDGLVELLDLIEQ